MAVGQPTSNFGNQGGGARGGKGKGGGKGRGGRRDPSAMFNSMDANGDGKLAGDEIPERMRQWSAQMDTNGDDAITLEELQTAINNFRGNGSAGPRKSRPKADQ